MENHIMKELCSYCNNISISDIMSILTFIIALYALNTWKKQTRKTLILDTHKELLHFFSE